MESASASGVIEQTTQSDYHSFGTTGGSVTLNVNVAQYGAMLHAQELILNSSGGVVASADNPGTLSQTITTNLSAGNYYLVVESDQFGTTIAPSEGYDIGQYTVSGTVPETSTASFSISGASSVNEQSTYTLSLSATDPGQTVSSWAITWGDGDTQNVSGNPSSVTHTFATGPNSYTISATATDGTGTYSASNTVAVTVAHLPPTLTLSGAASMNEESLYSLGLSGVELAGAGHTISAWLITWGDGSTSNVSGNPSSVTHTYSIGPNHYTITATATDDVGTYSASNTIMVSVAHVPPTLTLSGSSSVNEESLYTLDLSAVELAGHAIAAWSINWGDGDIQPVTGNPTSVTHVYALGPLSETISATATDDVGTYSAGNTVSVTVVHVPPTVTIAGASSAIVGVPYVLNLSAVEVASHSISGWVINWGDGSTPQSVSGDPSTVSHAYTTGSHSDIISATASDDVSAYSASSTVPVQVVPTVYTAAGTYYLALATDLVTEQIWFGSAGIGSPTYSISIASLPSLTFAGGPDSLTVDFSNGDSIPADGLSFTGGSGSNSLSIVGTSGNDTVTVSAGSIKFGGDVPITYTNLQSITVNGGSGADTFTQSAQPGAGATLTFLSTSADTLNIDGGIYTIPAPASGSGLNAYPLSTLDIAAGASVALQTAAAQTDRTVMVVGDLSIASTGQLDLGGNDLIVHNGSLPAITGLIAQGFNSGMPAWGGDGITSSLAATTDKALGVELNSDGAGGTLMSTFDNQVVTSTDVLVKYTFFGDANLSGSVDGADFSLIDNGHNSDLSGWRNGDFNYDGKINGDDFSLIDNASNLQTSTQPSSIIATARPATAASQQLAQQTVAPPSEISQDASSALRPPTAGNTTPSPILFSSNSIEGELADALVDSDELLLASPAGHHEWPI